MDEDDLRNNKYLRPIHFVPASKEKNAFPSTEDKKAKMEETEVERPRRGGLGFSDDITETKTSEPLSNDAFSKLVAKDTDEKPAKEKGSTFEALMEEGAGDLQVPGPSLPENVDATSRRVRPLPAPRFSRDFARFEKYSKGFGSRYLEKFQWRGRLGRFESGASTFVHVKPRDGTEGLGFGNKSAAVPENAELEHIFAGKELPDSEKGVVEEEEEEEEEEDWKEDGRKRSRRKDRRRTAAEIAEEEGNELVDAPIGGIGDGTIWDMRGGEHLRPLADAVADHGDVLGSDWWKVEEGGFSVLERIRKMTEGEGVDMEGVGRRGGGGGKFGVEVLHNLGQLVKLAEDELRAKVRAKKLRDKVHRDLGVKLDMERKKLERQREILHRKMKSRESLGTIVQFVNRRMDEEQDRIAVLEEVTEMLVGVKTELEACGEGARFVYSVARSILGGAESLFGGGSAKKDTSVLREDSAKKDASVLREDSGEKDSAVGQFWRVGSCLMRLGFLSVGSEVDEDWVGAEMESVDEAWLWAAVPLKWTLASISKRVRKRGCLPGLLWLGEQSVGLEVRRLLEDRSEWREGGVGGEILAMVAAVERCVSSQFMAHLRQSVIVPALEANLAVLPLDAKSSASWLGPWLPRVEQDLCREGGVLLERLKEAFRDWHPADRSAVDSLEIWRPILGSASTQSLLVSAVVPKLSATLSAAPLDEVGPLRWSLRWSNLLPPDILAPLLATHFFARWASNLSDTLADPSNSLAPIPATKQAASIYKLWTAELPTSIHTHPDIRRPLAHALWAIAVALLAAKTSNARPTRLQIAQAPDLTTSTTSSAPPTKRRQGLAAEAAHALHTQNTLSKHDVSLLDLLEHHAAAIDATVAPAGTRNGRALLAVQSHPHLQSPPPPALVFIDRGVFYLQTAPNTFTPAPIQQILQKSKNST